MKKANTKVDKTTVKAKGKKAAAAESLPVKAPRKLDISRDRVEIGTGQLKPAPWNPRGEISAESVADLVASIASVGIIEPLVVMESESGKDYIIIAGHRRAKAASIAKLEKVPCDVLKGIDATTAKHMTFIENLHRRDTDPLLESSLVAELIADGMTIDEVAAEIGRDRKWVMRRKNLLQLSPSWRKRAAKEEITTDCLEHIAAFPVELQERLKSAGQYYFSGLKWHHIESSFYNQCRDLRNVAFDTTDCSKCANNSGCCPDLFDWSGKPASLGKCTCAKCFKKKLDAHIAAQVKSAEEDGVAIIKHSPDYDLKTAKKKTKICCALYVYDSYGDGKEIVWGEPPKRKGKDGSPLTAEESEKERQKELAERREVRARNNAIRELASWCSKDTHLAKLLADFFKDPVSGETVPWAPFYVADAFSGIDSYNLAGSRTMKSKGAIAAIFGNLRLPVEWPYDIAAQIIQYLDPGKSQCYHALPNARLILAMFPDVRAEIGEDAAVKILRTSEVDKLKSPKIAWNTGKKDDPYDADDDDEAEDAEDAE